MAATGPEMPSENSVSNIVLQEDKSYGSVFETAVKGGPGEENKPETTLDDLLEDVGSFGKWQKVILFLVLLPASLPCGIHAFNQVFMQLPVHHHCFIEGSNLNYSQEVELLPINGGDSSSHSTCRRYDLDFDQLLDAWQAGQLNSSVPTQKCTDGWRYDGEIRSVVRDFTFSPCIFLFNSWEPQFDLVCDRELYPTIALAFNNLGSLIGVVVFGFISDRFGRRRSFLICLTVDIIGGIATYLANDYMWFTVGRVIQGLTNPAIWQIPTIIGMEIVGSNQRAFVSMMACFYFNISLLIATGFAYVFPYWKDYALATALPSIPLYILWWYMPESPRWLLGKGKNAEAFAMFKKIKKTNGSRLSDDDLSKLLSNATMSERKASDMIKGKGYLDLFKTPNLRKKAILINFIWLVNQMVYVGLSYYGPSMTANPYLGFLLSAIVDWPVFPIIWLAMDRIGRRSSKSISMIVGGICAIVTVAIPSGAQDAVLGLFLVSKLTINVSFMIIYPYAGELYPTEVRALGFALGSYIGFLGTIPIPFIVHLGTENLFVPLIILGCLSTVGGLLTLLLPETLGKPMPQTVEEAEKFGKGDNALAGLGKKVGVLFSGTTA